MLGGQAGEQRRYDVGEGVWNGGQEEPKWGCWREQRCAALEWEGMQS